MNIQELIKAAKNNCLMTYIANHRYEISKEDFSAIIFVLLDLLYGRCHSDEDEKTMCEILANNLEYEIGGNTNVQ